MVLVFISKSERKTYRGEFGLFVDSVINLMGTRELTGVQAAVTFRLFAILNNLPWGEVKAFEGSDTREPEPQVNVLDRSSRLSEVVSGLDLTARGANEFPVSYVWTVKLSSLLAPLLN